MRHNTVGLPSEEAVEFRYKAQGQVLAQFHMSDAEVTGIQGPLGSGKTAAAVAKVFKVITQARVQAGGVRRGVVVITRNTYPDLVTTTIRDWRAIVTDVFGRFKNEHPPVHELRFNLDDGTRVEVDVVFLALDRPDHVKKLRGFQPFFAWMNEAKEQPFAVFQMLRARLGRRPNPQDLPPLYYGMLLDYNAPDDDHWLADLMDKAARGELRGGSGPGSFNFLVQPGAVLRTEGDGFVLNPYAENLQNLPAGYYERLLYGNKPDWIRVNLANERGFAIDGKPVHADFNQLIHVAREPLLPTPNRALKVGLDFGLTPAAAFYQHQADGRWLGIDELVGFDMGIVKFLPLLQQRMAEIQKLAPGLTFDFVGDPSGDERVGTDEETVFRVMRAAGIPIRAAISNDVVLRRGALTRPLTRLVNGKPGILFSPRMKMTIKGLAGGFCYKRLQVAGDDRFRDVPDKNDYSHVVEAGEYALLDGGENARLGQQANANQFQGPIVVKTNWSPLD